MAFVLAVALIGTVYLSVALYAGGINEHRSKRPFFDLGNVPNHLAGDRATPTNLPDTKTLALQGSSLETSGFVLQVASTASENNALSLAESLHEKGFPAYMFKDGKEQFYKVIVGVYASADAASDARQKLEKQGFRVVLRPWSPL